MVEHENLNLSFLCIYASLFYIEIYSKCCGFQRNTISTIKKRI